MDAMETKIKFEAFGKTREKRNHNNKKNEVGKDTDENVDENQRNEELLKKQSEKIEAQVLEIKNKKDGSTE